MFLSISPSHLFCIFCIFPFSLGASDVLLCTVVEVDVLSDPNTFVPSSRACVHDHVSFDLPMFGSEDIKTGSTIELKKITLDESNAKIVRTSDSQIEEVPSNKSVRHRELAVSQGPRTVFVIRVNYRGKTPQLSKDDLAGRTFGLGKKQVEVSVAGQFQACSFGKIEMKPFQAEGVINGVAEVSISTTVSGSYSVLSLQNLVFEKIKKTWGIGQVDHFILVMPDAGLKYFGGSYLAYAYLNNDISVYHDLWGGRLSAVMHELGHNLGLHHSGQGSLEYGDRSGYMGYGTVEVGGPAMCFNAQKTWSLEWYEDRMLGLDYRDLPWGGSLSTFVDYDATDEGDYVVLRLGGRVKNNSLFLQYNRKKGINSGTAEFSDRVSIVQADLSDTYPISSFVKAIEPNEKGFFRYNNFENTGHDLVIKVCKRINGNPEGLRLSIHLDDGVQSDTCTDSLKLPRECADLNTRAFYVDEKQNVKKCSWLRRRAQRSSAWLDRLCKPGHLAYLYCQETCRSSC